MSEPKTVPRWRYVKRAVLILAAVIVSWFLYNGVRAYQELRDFDAATAFYEKEEYDKAATLFLPLAENWDIYSQHKVGLMYRDGNGVEQDTAEAYKWFVLAGIDTFAWPGLIRDYVIDLKFFRDVTRDREILEVGMSPEEITEGKRRANSWVEKIIEERCVVLPFSTTQSGEKFCLWLN